MRKKVCNEIIKNIESTDIRGILIVGENKVGKSEVINEIINKEYNSVYFIDTVNKVIKNNNPMAKFKDIKKFENITIERIKLENFNIKDTITEKFDSSLILNELLENFECYRDLIKNFFGYEIEIKNQENEFFNDEIVYYRNGEETKNLSSGEQAIIRMIVELIEIRIHQPQIGIIIIEEIEACLHVNYIKKLMGFLTREFEKYKFIITTHAQEVVLSAKNYYIYKLYNNSYEIFDSNDMNNLSYINRKLFLEESFIRSDNEKKLATYLKKIMIGNELTEDMKLEVIKLTNLSVKEKILKKYLLEWSGDC